MSSTTSEIPSPTSTTPGTTTSKFITTSRTTTQLTPSTTSKIPSTASTTPGTPTSTFTTTSITTTPLMLSTTSEIPFTTSTTPGITSSSLFTTSFTTTTLLTPSTTSENPFTTSTTPGTTSLTYTSTSSTTTTLMSSTTSELLSTTSTTSGITPTSTFTTPSSTTTHLTPSTTSEIPPTTSKTPGTTSSIFTSTSSTTSHLTPSTTSEIPSTTSTTSGTTTSTITTTSSTTTHLTPSTIPSTTSTTPETPTSTFTTTSITTTPLTPSTTSEISSTTNTTSSRAATSKSTPNVVTGNTKSTTYVSTKPQIVNTTTSLFTTTPVSTEITSSNSTTFGTTPTSTFTTTFTSTTPLKLSTTSEIPSTTSKTPGTTPTSTATTTRSPLTTLFTTTPFISPTPPQPNPCYKCININGSFIPVRRDCLSPQNITCQNHQPSVLLEDKHDCCPYYVCDCFCQGWSDSHYITFDGLYYTYQGNCTYILMKEISPQFNLTIYIENVYCDPAENVSCPRSLIVSYNEQNITLRNHGLMRGANLEALDGNIMLTLPYDNNGVRVISSDLNLLLEIPKLNAYVLYGITGFSINLPFQHFGKNTEGQCGTCNNNQNDDCSGSLANDCKVMAENWNNTVCTPPAPLPTPNSPHVHPDCYLLNTTFEACHSHVPPENFFSACQYDSINNPAGVCASLQSYASVCSMFGVCIYWRNYTSQCNIGCSEDKVFLPCGSFEPPTCRDRPMESNITVSTEGCFCSQNTTLFTKESGVCVPQPCGCLDQSGKPIEFHENYTHNCEDCVCDKARMSVICKPKKCPDVPPVNCTEPFMLVNVTDPSEPCCSTQVCKPKDVCDFNNTECKPGTKIHVDPCVECNCEWDPWTELYQMNCFPEVCPDDECFEGFEYVIQDGECCGTCKLMSCIYYRENNTKHILYDGDVKNFTCETVSCHEINGSFLIEKTKTVCPYSSTHVCEYGFEYVTKEDECCGTCEPVACIYHSPDNTIHILKDGENFEYKCQNVTCNEVNGYFEMNITSMECIQSSEACVSGFQYVKKDGECCGSCIQVACVYDAPDKTTHVLQDGLRYNFTCMNVTCLKRNDVFTIKESYKKCPSFNQDNCVEGTKQFDEDGCCPICETRNCAPVKNVTRLRVNNCTSTEDVEITSCAGHCDSKSMYSMWTNRNMTNSCSCCQAEKTSIREVTLMCEGDLQISQIYTYIDTCSCTPVMCEDYNKLRQEDYD